MCKRLKADATVDVGFNLNARDLKMAANCFLLLIAEENKPKDDDDTMQKASPPLIGPLKIHLEALVL